jgi:two-component system chemotaxis sensor kinase CheA
MAVPMLLVEETLNVTREALGSVRGRLLLPWRETVIPVIRLADAMPGCGASVQDDQYRLVVVRHESQVVALSVDAVVGHQEIVVKSLMGVAA